MGRKYLTPVNTFYEVMYDEYRGTPKTLCQGLCFCAHAYTSMCSVVVVVVVVVVAVMVVVVPTSTLYQNVTPKHIQCAK